METFHLASLTPSAVPSHQHSPKRLHPLPPTPIMQCIDVGTEQDTTGHISPEVHAQLRPYGLVHCSPSFSGKVGCWARCQLVRAGRHGARGAQWPTVPPLATASPMYQLATKQKTGAQPALSQASPTGTPLKFTWSDRQEETQHIASAHTGTEQTRHTFQPHCSQPIVHSSASSTRQVSRGQMPQVRSACSVLSDVTHAAQRASQARATHAGTPCFVDIEWIHALGRHTVAHGGIH